MKNLPQLELIWCRGALKMLQADLGLFAGCVPIAQTQLGCWASVLVGLH